MLLFRSIPRADTKERAMALLKRFGSLAEVLGAPEHMIRAVPDIGEAAALDLKVVGAARRYERSTQAQRGSAVLQHVLPAVARARR